MGLFQIENIEANLPDNPKSSPLAKLRAVKNAGPYISLHPVSGKIPFGYSSKKDNAICHLPCCEGADRRCFCSYLKSAQFLLQHPSCCRCLFYKAAL